MFRSARPLPGRHAERQAIDGLRAAARDEVPGTPLTGERASARRGRAIIPRKAQQFIAQRAKAQITKMQASRAVGLTQPAGVAEHIAAAAAQTRPGKPA